jgi:hypothetical protein
LLGGVNESLLHPAAKIAPAHAMLVIRLRKKRLLFDAGIELSTGMVRHMEENRHAPGVSG